jgi:hypothetical protein
MKDRTIRTGDRANRPTRVPVSGQRDIIAVSGKEPGFEYRIVKDKPGRIDKFLNAGYEIVTHEVQVGQGSSSRDVSEGSPVKVNLGLGDTGYLMRQREEFYQEDQAAKEQDIRDREQEMLDTSRRENYGKVEIRRGNA